MPSEDHVAETIMRLIFAIAIFAATFCFDIPASFAYGDAPWCAVVSLGKGAMQENCHYRTMEECLPNVLGGNRGFCNVNPRWTGTYMSRTSAQRKYLDRR